MKRYGVHVCPTCFEQAPPDADGNPEYQCDCDWGNRGLPVYIELAMFTQEDEDDLDDLIERLTALEALGIFETAEAIAEAHIIVPMLETFHRLRLALKDGAAA